MESSDATAECGPSMMLPLAPDAEPDQMPAGSRRPPHVRPAVLFLVFLGGAVGVAAREAVTLLLPSPGGFPWAIFCINVTGAFFLGALLEGLARPAPDGERHQNLRLLLGTGLIGGYTTYSALATDTAALVGSGSAGVGSVYATGTLLVAGLATWTGIRLADLTRLRRPGAGA